MVLLHKWASDEPPILVNPAQIIYVERRVSKPEFTNIIVAGNSFDDRTAEEITVTETFEQVCALLELQAGKRFLSRSNL